MTISKWHGLLALAAFLGTGFAGARASEKALSPESFIGTYHLDVAHSDNLCADNARYDSNGDRIPAKPETLSSVVVRITGDAHSIRVDATQEGGYASNIQAGFDGIGEPAEWEDGEDFGAGPHRWTAEIDGRTLKMKFQKRKWGIFTKTEAWAKLTLRKDGSVDFNGQAFNEEDADMHCRLVRDAG